MAIAGDLEVGILSSRDTDLLPALETISELDAPTLGARLGRLELPPA